MRFSKMGGREVIIDTNALFIPAQFHVDIFSELERLGYTKALVPREVMCELERVRKKLRGRHKVAAELALELLRKYNAEGRLLVVEVEECSPEDAADLSAASVDEALIRLAKRRGAAVLPNDSKLRRKLLKEGVTVVYLREKSRLEERGKLGGD